MITIDKKLPIPKGPQRGAKPKYPWSLMDVGHSFLFPKKTKRTAARSAAFSASKQNGKNFITRQTDEGLRCWRIA